jgi:putative acetyltransferase
VASGSRATLTERHDAVTAVLRVARPEDEAAVRDLVFDVLREYGLPPDPGRTDADLAGLPRCYVDAGGTFDVLVARDPGRGEGGEEVVGTVGLMPVAAGEVELRKMYLRPDWRGRGEGKRLLRHALARAGELGFRRVVLETASSMREARALYEAHGFRRYDPPHLSSRCDRAYALELAPDPGSP